MSEATGYEAIERKVAGSSYTPLQAWDDIRKVFELLRADENGALLVKGLADVTIGEISVDNVELIDSTGKKLLFTSSGEIKAYASDGSLVTLGTTTDAASANTVIGLLKALKAKDFATETTLATLATEAKAEAIRALLETISGLDFAEETTQAAIETAIGATTDADTELTVIGRLKKILATLEAGITVTESTPLTSIAATVADGDDVALGSTSDTDTATTVIGRLQKLITDLGTLADSKKLSDIVTSLGQVQFKGATSFVTGDVTVTTATAEIFAGVAALENRVGMTLINNGLVTVRVIESIGGDGLTLAPGMAITLHYADEVYAKTESDSASVNVTEWAGGEL